MGRVVLSKHDSALRGDCEPGLTPAEPCETKGAPILPDGFIRAAPGHLITVETSGFEAPTKAGVLPAKGVGEIGADVGTDLFGEGVAWRCPQG